MKRRSLAALRLLLPFAALSLAMPAHAAQDLASYTPEALDLEDAKLADAGLAVLVPMRDARAWLDN